MTENSDSTAPRVEAGVTPPPSASSGLTRKGSTASGVDTPRVERSIRKGEIFAGRYRIEQHFGVGGMGWVLRATDTRLNRPVALKVMRPELTNNPNLRARFEHEAQAATRMRSPHVVTVYDFGETDEGVLFLTMELLDGEPLSTRLRRRRTLPAQEAVRIAAGIARALVDAHAANVVHRDLKPANIFLTDPSDAVKVLDFGIAKILAADGDESVSLTATGTVVGTPLYISPELVQRQKPRPAADLYSLGVILFQMLAGAPPFVHEVPELVCAMHVRDPVPVLRERVSSPGVVPELERLVAELLSKNPAQRPSTEATLARLEAVQTNGLGEGDSVARDAALRPHVQKTVRLASMSPPVAHAASSPSRTEPGQGLARWIGLGLVALVGLCALGVILGLGVTHMRSNETPETMLPSGLSGQVAEEEMVASGPREPARPATHPPAQAATEPLATEAESAEPPADVGSLVLRSNVTSRVSVDGELRGRTPTTLELSSGEHAVVLRSSAGRRSFRVTIAAGETLTRSAHFSRTPAPAPQSGGPAPPTRTAPPPATRAVPPRAGSF